ncbi:CTD kinase-I gamma subunit [Scheffersomyces xylosifermentans]|uniref:CTD kinase-I gamma subunit n=1 Tax=Scheffersomyces xylosifermentans TaxID=1304137 RepID=UPI00315CB4B8
MDSFEAATQFSQILRALTPALPNLVRAAHFALKYSESEDYLFPSIVDILHDKNIEINTKSTIFQFIEVLVNESFYFSKQPKYNYPYIQSIKEALPQMILCVLPGTNNANIHNVYASLKSITKHFKIECTSYIEEFDSDLLHEQDLESLEKDLPFPDVNLEDELEFVDPLVSAWKLLVRKKRQSQYERVRLLKHNEVINKEITEDDVFNIKEKTDRAPDRLSKRQILARMEDDREGHKRSKETLWLVNRPVNSTYITEDEFLSHYWNKYNALTPEDDKAFLSSLEELNALVGDSYKDKQF